MQSIEQLYVLTKTRHENLIPRNKQTYPIVQTVTDQYITKCHIEMHTILF